MAQLVGGNFAKAGCQVGHCTFRHILELVPTGVPSLNARAARRLREVMRRLV